MFHDISHLQKHHMYWQVITHWKRRIMDASISGSLDFPHLFWVHALIVSCRLSHWANWAEGQFYPTLKVCLDFWWMSWDCIFTLWSGEGGGHGPLKLGAAVPCPLLCPPRSSSTECIFTLSMGSAWLEDLTPVTQRSFQSHPAMLTTHRQ